jgi:hypothetical protein
MNTDPSSRKNGLLPVVLLFSIAIPPLLYLYRDIDNNRLTSWDWAFSIIDPLTSLAVVCAAAALALLFVRWRGAVAKPVIFLTVAAIAPSIIMYSEPELIVDASRYFIQAKHLELYGASYFIQQWGDKINAWTDLPLIPFIYGLIFRYAGESRVFVQVLNTIMFALTALSVFHIGRTVGDDETALYSGLFMLSMPYVYTQVPLMLVDMGTMFLLTLSILIFIRAIMRGGIWIPAASMAIASLLFVKYSTWVMMSVFMVITAALVINRTIEGGKEGSRILLRALITGAAALVIISPVAFNYLDVIKSQIGLLLSYQKPALKGWGENYLSTFLFQIHPFVSGLAIWSLYIAVRRKDFVYAGICWLVILMLYLGGWRIRYMLPVFPMIAVMAGYGLREIPDKTSRLFTAVSAFTTSAAVALFIYLPFLGNMSQANLMKAGQHLNALKAGPVEVITAPSPTFTINPAVTVPILDLFTESKICYRYREPELPEKILTSPLRFSWTYKNPDFYTAADACQGGGPVVVIIPEYDQSIPGDILTRISGYEKKAEFGVTTEIFRYSPRVIIYQWPAVP